MTPWCDAGRLTDVPSPALLVHRDRVRENTRRMISLAGGADRLRPHIKTHKMPEVLRIQMGEGIRKFKCATLAEAEMAAQGGVGDLLIACQPVGPNVGRLIEMIQARPGTRFSTLVDDEPTLVRLGGAAAAASVTLDVWLDLDVGMQRTGVKPGPSARRLYALMARTPGLQPVGLHAYDGHLVDPSATLRQRQCEESFLPVAALRDALIQDGHPAPRIVAGGTPTFQFHAARGGVEVSPGTCVFWDAGYESRFPELGFQMAAALLTRVVSRSESSMICVDLGHKAVGSEMPHPRVVFPELPDARPVMHSEEHLVLETARVSELPPGSPLIGIPWHVCPTVALHDQAVVLGLTGDLASWKVAARARRLQG